MVRNDASDNAADGIRVTAASRDTTVERNAADRNGGDGIHVLSPLTTLTRNNADRNARLGIEAVPGVTDGGGNHARGNALGPVHGGRLLDRSALPLAPPASRAARAAGHKTRQ